MRWGESEENLGLAHLDVPLVSVPRGIAQSKYTSGGAGRWKGRGEEAEHQPAFSCWSLRRTWESCACAAGREKSIVAWGQRLKWMKSSCHPLLLAGAADFQSQLQMMAYLSPWCLLLCADLESSAHKCCDWFALPSSGRALISVCSGSWVHSRLQQCFFMLSQLLGPSILEEKPLFRLMIASKSSLQMIKLGILELFFLQLICQVSFDLVQDYELGFVWAFWSLQHFSCPSQYTSENTGLGNNLDNGWKKNSKEYLSPLAPT